MKTRYAKKFINKIDFKFVIKMSIGFVLTFASMFVLLIVSAALVISFWKFTLVMLVFYQLVDMIEPGKIIGGLIK